ncbi:hypothetical protein EK21DRAFT_25172, partial [Setomelanomma holmii]
ANYATTNPAMIQGRWGQVIHSQIRRFVVVRVKANQHFVEACSITTYGGRGCLKPGCYPSEHTAVYLKGCTPQYLEGERERGMDKDPVAIEATDINETMDPISRLRLGKVYSIECNVKVRDIGKVVPEDMGKLLHYHRQEMNNGFEPDDDHE